MIKYYYKPSTKQTFAVLRGCQLDAVNKISKMTGNIREVCLTTDYLMKDTYRVSVKCSDSDEFDVEKGKAYAKAKLMKKYYKDFDSKIDLFRSRLLELNDRVFETPDEVKNNT